MANKSDPIGHAARSAGLSKAAAARSLEAGIGAVQSMLKKNGTVTLAGFGTFSPGKRTGRNPRTGGASNIQAAKAPKFKLGKALKDALN